MRACSVCRGTFAPESLVTYQRADFCVRCKRDYFQHLAQGTRFRRSAPPHYFARRTMAKMVDANLITFFHFAMGSTLAPLSQFMPEYSLTLAGTLLSLLLFLGGSAVFTSRLGGTPGKLLFQLQVVHEDGTSIGFGKALVRAVAELLSIACAGLGYLLTDGEGQRRTLHDRISGTGVIARGGGWPWTP